MLILIPDHTRSLPLPSLFRSLVQWLQPVKQLGFMVALVTHLGLTAESLNLLVGITSEERSTIFREIGLFNHECNNPAALVLLGVMVHSTHLRGSGVMDNGIEKPNVRVTLASKISRADCERLNLGYLDPSKIDLNEWKDIEDARTVYVPRAGEVLYRLKP